jgi:hypothetical protein
LRALIERLRSPARKASSDAGPPDRWVFAGFGLAALIIAVGWFSGVLRDVPWPLWALIPVAILTIVGVADRDGSNIRRAMAYLAIQQRARWAGGPIPRGPSKSQAWLDDPANAGADGLQRVSMQVAVGDLAAAKATLDGYQPTTGVQVAAMARLRAHLQALETGTTDAAPILAATEGLSEDERRYQLTAAAWAQAWLDIEAHRPWRERFATAIRDLGPHPVPGRVLAFIGMQELAAPIATALATAIIASIFGW